MKRFIIIMYIMIISRNQRKSLTDDSKRLVNNKMYWKHTGFFSFLNYIAIQSEGNPCLTRVNQGAAYIFELQRKT